MSDSLLECALYSYTDDLSLLHSKLISLRFVRKSLHVNKIFYEKDGNIAVYDVIHQKIITKSKPDYDRNRCVTACKINTMDVIECSNVNDFMAEMNYTFYKNIDMSGFKYYKGDLNVDLLHIDEQVKYLVHAYVWTTDLQQGESLLVNLSNELENTIRLTKL